MTEAKAHPIPALSIGKRVRFHPIIGGKHDGNEYTVRDLGHVSSRPVAWLNGKSGCVAIEALSEAPDVPLHAPETVMETHVNKEVEAMLNITDSCCNVIAMARATYKLGGLPLTTIQKLKLKVSLQQMGRAAWCLADELDRFGTERSKP
jgi:hypothetical protein